jgi:PiT family inorganic phosphate transporter
VIGAGAARRASAVNWGIARSVMVAWVITIPASATVAALFYWAVSDPARGVVGLEVIALIGFAIFAWRERRLQTDSYGRTFATLASLGFLTAAAIVGYALAS